MLFLNNCWIQNRWERLCCNFFGVVTYFEIDGLDYNGIPIGCARHRQFDWNATGGRTIMIWWWYTQQLCVLSCHRRFYGNQAVPWHALLTRTSPEVGTPNSKRTDCWLLLVAMTFIVDNPLSQTAVDSGRLSWWLDDGLPDQNVHTCSFVTFASPSTDGSCTMMATWLGQPDSPTSISSSNSVISWLTVF